MVDAFLPHFYGLTPTCKRRDQTPDCPGSTVSGTDSWASEAHRPRYQSISIQTAFSIPSTMPTRVTRQFDDFTLQHGRAATTGTTGGGEQPDLQPFPPAGQPAREQHTEPCKMVITFLTHRRISRRTHGRPMVGRRGTDDRDEGHRRRGRSSAC